MAINDAQKALMLARRLRFADGGGAPFLGGGALPLLGDTAVEAVTNDQGHHSRSWVPSTIAGKQLPAVVNGEPSPVVKQELVAPVYRSLTHEALSDPNALGSMKSGNPQQWMNALTKAGAKKEELEWLGINQGHPGTKVNREEMLERAKKRMPQMSEKLMGDKNQERVLVSGNPDEDEDVDPYETVALRHGDWETEEPNESWISDSAHQFLKDTIDEKMSDPEQANDHLSDALDEYANKWLRHTHSYNGNGDERFNPDSAPEHRVAGFLKEVTDNGWALPEKTKKVVDEKQKHGQISAHTWNDFINHTLEGVQEKFGKNDDAEHHPTLPGIEADDPSEKTETNEWLEPFNDAVKRLHGFATTPLTGNITTTTPSSAIQRERHGSKPDLMGDLHEEAIDKLLPEYEDMERQSYYDSGEAPRKKEVHVEDDYGNELGPYTVYDSGFGSGEYVVQTPNGGHMGTTHSENEASHLILSHAYDHGDWGPNHGRSGPQYEDRQVPEDNMTVPMVQGSPRFKNYALPGLSNYREHTLHIQPEGQDFTRGHFDPNAVVHMRYGDARDENGKRLLHVDEIQSDWHQKGRDEGYLTGDAAEKQRQALQELPHARKDYEETTNAWGNVVGNNNVNGILATALLDPATVTRDELRGARHVFSNLPWQQSGNLIGEETQFDSPEAIVALQKYLHDHVGADYKEKILEHNRRYQRYHDLSEASEGNLVPDAPWKDSSDWAKLALKRAMRIASDYGYDGLSLSPGWVQSRRWGGNEGHMGLYDKTFAGALEKVAKEVGAKATKARVPLLGQHSMVSGHGGDGMGHESEAPAVYLTPEIKQKIRKEGFKLFRRGGSVKPSIKARKIRRGRGTEKDARKALLIAKGQNGSAIPQPLGGMVEQALKLTHKYLAANKTPVYNSS